MICQQFEQLAHQIARNELRDAKLLQDAHNHAANCAACNAQLVEARELAASVAAVAVLDKSLEAPLHLESTLCAAFIREHAAESPSQAVVATGPRRARFSFSTWAALSLAAVAAIFAVIFLPRIIHRNSGPDIAKQTPAPTTSPAVNTAKPAPVAVSTPANESPKHLNATHRPKKHLTEPEKTLTGFLALPYADDLATVEYGAVVRMQMSRADLAWLGLPVPVSDSGQKIVADLFVNGSGTPEAIRLVR